jgi:hypothetical protein
MDRRSSASSVRRFDANGFQHFLPAPAGCKSDNDAQAGVGKSCLGASNPWNGRRRGSEPRERTAACDCDWHGPQRQTANFNAVQDAAVAPKTTGESIVLAKIASHQDCIDLTPMAESDSFERVYHSKPEFLMQ